MQTTQDSLDDERMVRIKIDHLILDDRNRDEMMVLGELPPDAVIVDARYVRQGCMLYVFARSKEFPVRQLNEEYSTLEHASPVL